MTLPSTARTDHSALVASSADLIASLQQDGGAYPASPTFSAYAGYSWFRDGAFIADAMSAYGRAESAERFLDWCAAVVEARAGRIREVVDAAASGRPVPDARMLATRFTFDGREGDADWWDFQLDGYGTWLWAAGEHVRRHGADASRWATAVALTVDYLVSSWERPCYDWWEEHAEHVHLSTLGCIAVGLRAASGLGVLDARRRDNALDAASAIETVALARGITARGGLAKWLGSDAVDASLASIVGLLGFVEPRGEIAVQTIGGIERDLTVDGGVHRYLGDTYFGGGQWPLLSCFLGIAHARAGELDRARDLLDWTASTAGADGSMPEQVERHLLDRSRVDEWVERWGPSADPLLWTHAMFIRLAVELDGTDPQEPAA